MTQYQATFVFTAQNDAEGRDYTRRILVEAQMIPDFELVGLAAATWREIDFARLESLERVIMGSDNSERASDSS